MGARVNGTYHAAARTGRARLQTRLLIGAGAFMGVLGLLNVVLTHRDMDEDRAGGAAAPGAGGQRYRALRPESAAQFSAGDATETTVNAPDDGPAALAAVRRR